MNKEKKERYSYHGQEVTLCQLANRLNISPDILGKYLSPDITAEEAVMLARQDVASHKENPVQRKYSYRGELHTARRISNFSNVPLDILLKYLPECDTGDEAIIRAREEISGHKITTEPKYITIVFRKYIEGVKASMQPQLNTEYTATPQRCPAEVMPQNEYFIISLENGRPLIVYPREFEVVHHTAAQRLEAPAPTL